MPDNGTIFETLSLELNLNKLKSDLEKAKRELDGFADSVPRIDANLINTSEVVQGARQIGNETSRIATNFQSIGQGFGKLTLAVGAAQVALQLLLEPVLQFVGAFREGIELNRELQKQTEQLATLLATNAQFAEDQASNYLLAEQAAKGLATAQADVAAKAGIAAKEFFSTFRSFADSGGLKGVQQAGDDAATTFDRANRTVALLNGALSTAKDKTSEIQKLLQGELTKRDSIVLLSGLTAKESEDRQVLGADRKAIRRTSPTSQHCQSILRCTQSTSPTLPKPSPSNLDCTDIRTIHKVSARHSCILPTQQRSTDQVWP
jgi:hypothetical protein